MGWFCQTKFKAKKVGYLKTKFHTTYAGRTRGSASNSRKASDLHLWWVVTTSQSKLSGKIIWTVLSNWIVFLPKPTPLLQDTSITCLLENNQVCLSFRDTAVSGISASSISQSCCMLGVLSWYKSFSLFLAVILEVENMRHTWPPKC